MVTIFILYLHHCLKKYIVHFCCIFCQDLCKRFFFEKVAWKKKLKNSRKWYACVSYKIGKRVLVIHLSIRQINGRNDRWTNFTALKTKFQCNKIIEFQKKRWNGSLEAKDLISEKNHMLLILEFHKFFYFLKHTFVSLTVIPHENPGLYIYAERRCFVRKKFKICLFHKK